MPSFNRVTLIGNLTRDPQLKQLSSNTTLADFGLAMNRRFRTSSGEEREEVCYVDCTAFGRQAEVIGQHCRKGKPLFVEARLKYEQWDDKFGAGKRSKLSIIVENFQFLGPREESATIGQQKTFSDPDQSRPRRQAAEARSRAAEGVDEALTDSDIPF